MTRVALVSPYALGIFGGVQEQALSMSRELSARGHEVLLVTPRGGTDALDTPARVAREGAALKVPANGSEAPLALSPAASHRAREAIDDFSPDVIHLHEPLAPLMSYATLRAHHAPIVGTFHRSGSGPAYSLTKPVTKHLVRSVDVAVAVSQAAADTAREGLGVDCEVLFNGFETERYRVEERGATPRPVVLFVGRLEARKGARTLVEAALKSAGALFDLRIAGDGPQRHELEALAKSEPSITFLGAVSDQEKRRALRSASVAVAASTHGESFGLVILEAMAAETPVVVSDIDGYREAAGGCAQLFAPGDADSLLAAITAVLASDQSNRIRLAREHAEQWSMARLVDLYLDRYERAAGLFAASR